MATEKDELLHLIEDLPDEDVAWLVSILHSHSQVRAKAAELQAREAERQARDNEAHAQYAISDYAVREWRAKLQAHEAERNADKVNRVTALEDYFRNQASSKPVSHVKSSAKLRWPALGPAALGAAVVVGWAAGLVGGPLLAIVGGVAGLLIGDVLDRTTAPADA